MYGTLGGALAGRKIGYDRASFKATVEGRISGVGKTIRIKSIRVHYDLAVPAEAREATERALAVHTQGKALGYVEEGHLTHSEPRFIPADGHGVQAPRMAQSVHEFPATYSGSGFSARSA